MNNIIIKLIWFIFLQLNLYGIMNQETMETVIGAGKYDVLACSLNGNDPMWTHLPDWVFLIYCKMLKTSS